MQALRGREETRAGMAAGEAAREARAEVAGERAREGRGEVEAELDKPFARHAAESLPFIGGWLAGRMFGTAGNEAPDGTEQRPAEPAREERPQ